MDILQTFLNLTEYTIPFGEEYKLEKYLPKDIIKDEFGNYYIQIGNSDIMFTAHLDSYCTRYEKVKHVITDEKISTDGTTILGADNKAGVTLLLHMIEHNIDGLYYFFIGEESVENSKNKGLYGSLKVAQSKKWNDKINKVISFDRKEKGSVISKQLGMNTCSDNFCKALIENLNKSRLTFEKDETGICTDSASFMYNASECTNISNGTYNEHTFDEYLDLKYFYDLCDAVIKTNWSNLPYERIIPKVILGNKPLTFDNFMKFSEIDNFLMEKMNNGFFLYNENKDIEIDKMIFFEFGK
jgi:hypothetical protein